MVRAVIEHNLVYEGPKRLWYKGPMFRHERPQRGRYRQFFQIGAEAIGFAGPDIDAELIMLCRRLWDDLGLENIRLELNSIGDAAERHAPPRRPDRLLRSERSACSTPKPSAACTPTRCASSTPRTLPCRSWSTTRRSCSTTSKASRWPTSNGVKRILDHNNIPYTVNPRLVRGLDYYNRTVFEWVTDELGAQGTVCAGGRYDPLIETFGGKPTPAVGFAMGIERLIELMKLAGEPAAPAQCDVYMVHQGEAAQTAGLHAGRANSRCRPRCCATLRDCRAARAASRAR